MTEVDGDSLVKSQFIDAVKNTPKSLVHILDIFGEVANEACLKYHLSISLEGLTVLKSVQATESKRFPSNTVKSFR